MPVEKIWHAAMKIVAVIAAPEMPSYREPLQSIAKGEQLRAGNPETKSLLLRLMEKLEALIPELNGIFVDETIRGMGEKDVNKILRVLEWYGLKAEKCMDVSLVLKWFQALVDDFYA